jgi:hypothetical protein
VNRALRQIPVFALAAIALAACGSSSNNSTAPSLGGGTHTEQSASSAILSEWRSEWRAAISCVRRHGMPSVPDPVVGANGQISVPGYTSADLTPAARSACAAQIQALSSTSSTDPILSTSDIQALLRWAACMRAHGLPRWPDPNDRGEFHVKSADAGTLVQNNRATAACKPLIPPYGPYLTVTPSGQ